MTAIAGLLALSGRVGYFTDKDSTSQKFGSLCGFFILFVVM
jgi:hypothetical protein